LSNLNSPIESFICQALRGEPAPWDAIDCEISDAEFITMCRHHGVQALLCHCMHERPEWFSWPNNVRQELSAMSQANVAQELIRNHHLNGLLKIFLLRNIRCLLLKGEALARTHYAAPGVRTRGDCDLFFDLREIVEARQAVLDAGLRIVSPVYKSHQFTVRRPVKGHDVIEFDVHSRILNHPRYARVLSFDEAFNNSVPVPGLSTSRALHPVDALLHACLHRVANKRHDPDRLIWIYDIHILVDQMTVADLREFAKKVMKKNVQIECLEGLLIAQDCFHTNIPREVVEDLMGHEASSYAAWRRRFAHSNLSLLIDDFRVLPSFRSRWGLLRELFFPSSDSLMRRYKKTNRMWLPYLYLNQVLGGIVRRLSLH